MPRSFTALVLLGFLISTVMAWGQAVEIDPGGEPDTYGRPKQPEKPKAGSGQARDYFKARSQKRSTDRRPANESGGPTPRYLTVGFGSFFADQGYRWGKGDQEDIGKLNVGVTYRMGEWVNSMDLAMRVDYTTYELDEDDARKLTFGGIITFPDSNSHFPLYFGGGLGLGFFVKQINNESAIALDYSIFGGVRFLNIFESFGFFVESGIKNHLHLFSDGQFNGVFINFGPAFAF